MKHDLPATRWAHACMLAIEKALGRPFSGPDAARVQGALLANQPAALAAPVSTGERTDVIGLMAPTEVTQAWVVAWVRRHPNGTLTTDVLPHPIEEVRQRSGAWLPLYAAPPAGDDARDAARYRWVKDRNFRCLSADIDGRHVWVPQMAGSLRGSTLDEAVDAAMRAQGEGK